MNKKISFLKSCEKNFNIMPVNETKIMCLTRKVPRIMDFQPTKKNK